MSEAKRIPRVRVLHASPKAPAVDIYVDGERKISGLAYGQVSEYMPLSAERHSIRLLQAGMGSGSRSLLDGHLPMLEEVQDYTVVALGQVRALHTLLLNDTTSAPDEGQAKLRVVHASPDAPAVDVAVSGGPVLFSEVAFDSATPFMEVAAGTYDLEMRRAGAREAVVMALPDYDMTAGNLYTLVAMGLLDGTPGFMVMPMVESYEMCLEARTCL